MALDDSSVMIALLALFGAAVLIAFVFMLRWEHREFVRRGQGPAWLVVRLAAIPIAAATVASTLLPARGVSGLEALGVFYLLLFTAAPLTWFGLHWLVGRMARPALGFGDSFQLAVVLPAFVIAVALVAHQLQPLGWAIAIGAQRAGYGLAEDSPPHHELAAARRYATPTGDLLVARWQAAPGVQVERIDLVTAEAVIEDAGRQQMDRICQAPGTIVLVRPASEPTPALRVYWRDADTRLKSSTLTPPAAGEAVPFAVEWQGTNGFTLPEPLPRQSVWIARPRAGRPEFGSSEAQQYRPGESAAMNCLAPGWQSEQPVAGLQVRISNRRGQPIWLEALRPGAKAAADQSS